MGQVANWLADGSLSKEENPFYLETKNLMKKYNYAVNPFEKKSE